jgi:hypothetical protein
MTCESKKGLTAHQSLHTVNSGSKSYFSRHNSTLFIACSMYGYQCFGSGIRCLFDPGMGRKSASGFGIRDEQPGSYFLELRIHFCS